MTRDQQVSPRVDLRVLDVVPRVVSIPISEKSFIAGKVDASSNMRKSVPVKTPTCGIPESPPWQYWDRETRV